MNLKISANAKPEGTVIESRIDKGLGVVITALVQRGTLRIGDYVLAGPSWGRVRRLISDQGEDLKEAGPSTPVQVGIAIRILFLHYFFLHFSVAVYFLSLWHIILYGLHVYIFLLAFLLTTRSYYVHHITHLR